MYTKDTILKIHFAKTKHTYDSFSKSAYSSEKKRYKKNFLFDVLVNVVWTIFNAILNI